MAKNKEKFALDKFAGKVIVQPIKPFLFENYLPYAHYVIQSRALVGKDGLKPVLKRGIWTMWTLGLKNNKPTMKAATVYNHVVGHYHPHGPSSVTEAMVKLAQDFHSRVPVVEVQGGFGLQTGDTPPSDRYYEVKFTLAGEQLVEDVDYHAVEMVPNFTGAEKLPKSLPVKWPFSVINGGQGIAVGYATNMIPHNPDEVMNAVIKRMQGKLNTVDQLIRVMPGPDFPTYGQIFGIDGIKEYYETGKGSFLVRSKYEVNSLPRGKHEIVFTEFPYQISIEKIKEEIAKVKETKNKLTEIVEAKNLSDKKRGNVLSIDVKAGANPYLVLEDLFKLTSLETNFSVNMTTLDEGRPVVSNMFDLIDTFIDQRKEAFINKLEYKLDNNSRKLEQRSGVASVLSDLDKTINIIRKSESSEEARNNIMQHFGINEAQADYVLKLSLSVLTKADKDKILLEIEALRKETEELENLLNDEAAIDEAIIEELKATKKAIADERRTFIDNVTLEDMKLADKESRNKMKLLEKNVDTTIYILSNGTILQSLDETFNTHVPIKSELKATTQEVINVLKNDGTVESLNAKAIPLDIPSSTSLLGVEESKFVTILPSNLNGTYKGVLIVTDAGNVNIVKNNIKSPLAKMILNEKIIYAKPLTEEDYEKYLYIIAEDGQLAKFPISTIRESNPGSGTVAGFKYDKKSVAAGIGANDAILFSKSNSSYKFTQGEEVPSTNRGVKGSKFHDLVKDDEITGLVVAEFVKVVDQDAETIAEEYTGRAKKGIPYDEDLFFGY